MQSIDISNLNLKEIQYINGEQFENLLKKKSISELEQEPSFKPMSIKEFNERIDKSENDFKNGRYKSTSELLKKYNS